MKPKVTKSFSIEVQTLMELMEAKTKLNVNPSSLVNELLKEKLAELLKNGGEN